jgi:hypothetical protein
MDHASVEDLGVEHVGAEHRRVEDLGVGTASGGFGSAAALERRRGERRAQEGTARRPVGTGWRWWCRVVRSSGGASGHGGCGACVHGGAERLRWRGVVAVALVADGVVDGGRRWCVEDGV